MNAHVRDICKIGQGHAYCRYLLAGPAGFECGKLDLAARAYLDGRVRAETFTARGDNCGGKSAAMLKEAP